MLIVKQQLDLPYKFYFPVVIFLSIYKIFVERKISSYHLGNCHMVIYILKYMLIHTHTHIYIWASPLVLITQIWKKFYFATKLIWDLPLVIPGPGEKEFFLFNHFFPLFSPFSRRRGENEVSKLWKK